MFKISSIHLHTYFIYPKAGFCPQPKFEILNPKFETNSNNRNIIIKLRKHFFPYFDHLNFSIVSYFVLRNSDFLNTTS